MCRSEVKATLIEGILCVQLRRSVSQRFGLEEMYMPERTHQLERNGNEHVPQDQQFTPN
jgi:hypothetical protein